MYFTFRGGNEFVKLKIDRINKILDIATRITNYRFVRQPYIELFGYKRGNLEEAKEEMAEMALKNDEEFEERLIEDFRKIGYELVRKVR